MRENIPVIMWTIVATLVASAVLAATIYGYSRWLGIHPPVSETEAFFGYFSNSVGLAIGAAGTITAIVLAYNALRTSEIQTTTVVLQEFRPEIERFIESSNQLYQYIFELIEAGLALSRSASSLVSELSPDPSVIKRTECSTDVTDLEEYEHGFFIERRKFIDAANKIHSMLDGYGNIFFREMISENAKSCDDEIRKIKNLQGRGFQFPVAHDDASGIDFLRNLNLVADEAVTCRSMSVHTHDHLVDLRSAIRYGSCAESGDSNQVIEKISKMLPNISLMPKEVDWESAYFRELTFGSASLITDIPDSTDPTSDKVFRLSSQEYPTGQREIYITECALSDLEFPYETLLRVYLRIVDPSPGVKAMRRHFASFGAREDVLHLFIDAHEARLAFNYRGELKSLF